MKKKIIAQTKPKRKSAEIQFWLKKRFVSQRSLAKKIGVHESIVSLFIAGKGNNQRVLKHLKSIEMPEEYLGVKK